MNDISQDNKKLYSKLKAMLLKISLLYKSILIGEKFCFIVSLLLGEILAAIFLDNFFHLDPISRLFFFALTFGLVLYLLITLILSWRKPITFDQTALLIEKKFPHLENSLINALQLGREKLVSSFEIVNLLIKDTFNKIKTLPLTQALEYKKFFKLSSITFTLLLICLLYALFFPGHFKNGLWRLLNPFSDIQPILRTQIKVSPSGDISVLKGDNLSISATLSGKIVDNVIIYYTVKGEKKEFSLMTKTEIPNQFSYQFNKILKPIEFQIKASDAKTAKTYIKVIHPPLVTGINFEITYPQYANLNNETIVDSGGNLHVLEGSTIKIKIKTNKPSEELSEINLIKNDKEKIPLTPFSQGTDSFFETTFTVTETFTYKLELIDKEGYKNSKDLSYVIERKEDNPPILFLEEPEGNLKVEKTDIIPLRAKIKDDYGITQVSLNYTIGNMPEKSILLQQPSEPLKELSVNYKWDLGTLNLKEGDVINFTLIALDNDTVHSFHRSQTENHTISIMDLYDRRKVILKKLTSDLALLKKLFLAEFILKEKIKDFSDPEKQPDLPQIDLLLDRQEKINLKIKDLELSLKNLKQKQAIDESNKLTLLWMLISELVTKDIYAYDIELIKMLHSDRIKDKQPIIKEIAAWQHNFSKKLLQLWQQTITTYCELYLKNILDKLSDCIKTEESIKSQLLPLLNNSQTTNTSLLLQQQHITSKAKEFMADISKSGGEIKLLLLDNNFLQILERISNAFLKEGHIYSYMSKTTSGIKNKEIEAALKNIALTISKLNNLNLDLLNPLEQETSHKIKLLTSFLTNISDKISKLIAIEKSSLVYLNNQKLAGALNYSADLINYHGRIYAMMQTIVEDMRNKPKEDTSKFRQGLKYLEEATADKQNQIQALQRSNIHQAIFKTKTIIQNLEQSLQYFSKVKEKISKITPEKLKEKISPKLQDLAKPRIKFLKPGSDLVVLPNAEIPLVVEAKDDYGIASIDLIYQISPGNTEEIINIGTYPQLQETAKATYYLRLKTLGIKDKTTITYYAQAVDDDILQKNVTRSRSYQITVIPANLLSETKKATPEKDNTSEKIKDLVKEILIITFSEQVKLQEEVEKLKTNEFLLSKDLKQRYNALITRQKMLQTEINSVLEILKNIDQKTTGNKIVPFVDKVFAILTEISTQDMPKIINQLETLSKAAVEK